MISVCMATYNGEKYIKDQLDSILCQLGEDDEVIISDDSSTDNTLNIVRSYNDYRIRILNHNPVSGSAFVKATRNFENALRYANGDYIFLSDQDDVWYNDKVDLCLKYLKEHILVQHLRSYIVTKEDVIYPPQRRFPKNLLEAIIFLPACYSGCCMAFRKELLPMILPIPKIIPVHDGWIGCLAFMNGNIKSINLPLIKYRIDNTTVSYGKSRNSFIKKVIYRFRLFYCLIIRKYLRR